MIGDGVYEPLIFELLELKLIIVAVDSSMFISEKKNPELKCRLVSLSSPRKADALSKAVYISA